MAFLSQQFRSDAQHTAFKIIATNAENNTLLQWNNLRIYEVIELLIPKRPCSSALSNRSLGRD